MWRGLMLTKAVEQFLRDVQWGDIDYLLIDMPPGTGDVQMGLARMLPRTDLIIVTTPAVSAQKVAIRAADMARRSYLRVAGVIENMSAFTCDHGEHVRAVRRGRRPGAGRRDRRRAARAGPARTGVAAAGDAGEPVAPRRRPGRRRRSGPSPTASSTETVPPVEMAGCSARLLEQSRWPSAPRNRRRADRLSVLVARVSRKQDPHAFALLHDAGLHRWHCRTRGGSRDELIRRIEPSDRAQVLHRREDDLELAAALRGQARPADGSRCWRSSRGRRAARPAPAGARATKNRVS